LRIARHGDQLDEALAQIDVDTARRERADVEKLGVRTQSPTRSRRSTAQIASAEPTGA